MAKRGRPPKKKPKNTTKQRTQRTKRTRRTTGAKRRALLAKKAIEKASVEKTKTVNTKIPAPDLFKDINEMSETEAILKIVERLLMSKYRWTSNKTTHFLGRVRTMIENHTLPIRKATNTKTKSPTNRLVRTPPKQNIPMNLPEPRSISNMDTKERLELEKRTQKLVEELKKKGLYKEPTSSTGKR